MKRYYATQLQQVVQKCLDVMKKYKKTQLPFYDEVRVFDPRKMGNYAKRHQAIREFLLPSSNGCMDCTQGVGRGRAPNKQGRGRGGYLTNLNGGGT